MTTTAVLSNGGQSATFVSCGDGFRPEWFRLGDRLMLRFKDHEFLNVGGVRVTEGALLREGDSELCFGGTVVLAGADIDWLVTLSLSEDGGTGFVVHTELIACTEPVELMEAMSAFELPYEYDGTEHQMTVMSQQPVYRSEGNTDITGAGYVHPNWYYGRPGRAHLTFPTQTPVMCCRVADADDGNERCTTLIANWDVCSFKDLFAQPTREWAEIDGQGEFPHGNAVAGRRGRKFLVGAANWNVSLHKDPNYLAEPGVPLQQELIVDFVGEIPGARWDTWLADAWERAARWHFPEDGRVPAWEVARSRGAGWVEAADWLAAQFQKPEGYPGLFYPEGGTCVYAPHTRPKWDEHGVADFCGQWIGPLSYLGHVWADDALRASTGRLEVLFARDHCREPGQIWTIGPTPQHCAVMRKARLEGISPAVEEKVRDYVVRRTEVVLNPPAGGRRGDGGILAWDAFANLLAADLFDTENREAAARELLARVTAKLDERFEGFNCAAEGDFVGAGQGRPFGHGIAMSANVLAHARFGDPAYLDVAERCANIMMGLYYGTCNLSPVPDMDTRGWAVGSNGGRDQLCHMPPWETAFALQQLAYLIEAGRGRNGFYDLLWLFAHTGLCMFPKARALKRLYTPDLTTVYRPIESLPSEREFYLSLPYLAYEEPWDQTMLAGYQGVEPLILALYLGGGLAAAEDDRVLALVPRAAMYDADVARQFVVHLWNPLDFPIETRVGATVACRRHEAWHCDATGDVELSGESAWTSPITVPPREVMRVGFRRR